VSVRHGENRKTVEEDANPYAMVLPTRSQSDHIGVIVPDLMSPKKYSSRSGEQEHSPFRAFTELLA